MNGQPYDRARTQSMFDKFQRIGMDPLLRLEFEDYINLFPSDFVKTEGLRIVLPQTTDQDSHTDQDQD